MTTDQNLRYQQNLARRRIAIVVLKQSQSGDVGETRSAARSQGTGALGSAFGLALHRLMQIPVRLQPHPQLRRGFQ